MKYDYEYISKKTKFFKNAFIIGRSLLNRCIYCIPIGGGPLNVVFAAAFHSLEYLTAPALLNFAEEFTKMKEYHDKVSAFFIPMINPDGIDIAQHGIDPKNQLHQKLIRFTGIIDFQNQWQANAAGVDINHNFDANWQSIRENPSSTKYGGPFPESEPETRAISNFLRKCQPELFIAFHSQGKEIYYDFNGMENKRSKSIAEQIAEQCRYRVSTPIGTAAFGGAKDWYIQEFSKPSFTIELGYGKNPLPVSDLSEMIRDTRIICLSAINEILKY